jgi:hypothetical protein
MADGDDQELPVGFGVEAMPAAGVGRDHRGERGARPGPRSSRASRSTGCGRCWPLTGPGPIEPAVARTRRPLPDPSPPAPS